MKPQPNYPKPERSTSRIFGSLAVSAIMLILILVSTSCVTTTAKDGTTTTSPDRTLWLDALHIVVSEKAPKATVVPTK